MLYWVIGEMQKIAREKLSGPEKKKKVLESVKKEYNLSQFELEIIGEMIDVAIALDKKQIQIVKKSILSCFKA